MKRAEKRESISSLPDSIISALLSIVGLMMRRAKDQLAQCFSAARVVSFVA